MKNALTLAVLVAAFLVACPARAQVSFGDAVKFNDEWLFLQTDDHNHLSPSSTTVSGVNSGYRTTGPSRDSYHPPWQVVPVTYREE